MAKKPTKGQAAGGFKPSSLTAYERYQVLSPILSEGTRAYMRLFEPSSGAEHAPLEAIRSVKSDLSGLLRTITANSPMSEEETHRAFHGFIQNGWSGLLTPIPISAEHLLKNFVGTWELAARYTNGGDTALARTSTATTRARSNIYFAPVPGKKDELFELQIMWNEENHYPRNVSLKMFADQKGKVNSTFLIAALMRTRITQVDDYTVELAHEGQIVGNHGHYTTPTDFKGRVQIGSTDGYNTMLRMQDGETCQASVRGVEVPVAGMFILLNVQSGYGRLTYRMTGLPATDAASRSMDVVDNYAKISSQPPLVGGWEPVDEYFERIRDHIIRSNPPRARLAQFDVESPKRR